MRPGYALYNHRFARFSARAAATTTAAILLALPLAAQAQESVEEVALPAWTEPTLPSSEAAPPAESAPLPSVPESLPSTPTESLPSSSSPLPSGEEAFPTTPDPWSSSGSYTTAQTSVIGTPNSGGPYGGFSTKNIAVDQGVSSEARRFYWGFMFTVRGVWDDNIYLSNTNKTADYFFALEPTLTLGFGDIQGKSRSYLR